MQYITPDMLTLGVLMCPNLRLQCMARHQWQREWCWYKH